MKSGKRASICLFETRFHQGPDVFPRRALRVRAGLRGRPSRRRARWMPHEQIDNPVGARNNQVPGGDGPIIA